MNTLIKAGSEQNWQYNNMYLACNFNMNCNLKCSYCINQTVRKNYTEQLSQKALYNLFSNLPLLKKDFYTFGIAGGEPSLYTYFPEMLKYLKDFFSPDTFQLGIATNGSLLHKLEEYFQNYQNFNYCINISLHLEQIQADTYLKKLSEFKYPHKSIITLMLEPGTLEQVKHIKQKAERFGYEKFKIMPISINLKLHPDYTEEEIEYLKTVSYGSETNLFNEYLDDDQIIKKEFTKTEYNLDHQLINYSGLQCLAGCNSLKILPDGTIHPCHWHRGDPNFNLNTRSLLDYTYIYQPIICKSSYCGCHSFTALPKWNPEYAEAPYYFFNKTQS